MRYTVILMITMLLSIGCANPGLNTKFSCGVGKGVGCQSVSDVNQMVESGQINAQKPEATSKKSMTKNTKLKYAKPHKDTTGPSRYPEKQISIWFSPYVDEQDNFHEQRRLYSIVKDGEWGF